MLQFRPRFMSTSASIICSSNFATHIVVEFDGQVRKRKSGRIYFFCWSVCWSDPSQMPGQSGKWPDFVHVAFLGRVVGGGGGLWMIWYLENKTCIDLKEACKWHALHCLLTFLDTSESGRKELYNLNSCTINFNRIPQFSLKTGRQLNENKHNISQDSGYLCWPIWL